MPRQSTTFSTVVHQYNQWSISSESGSSFSPMRCSIRITVSLSMLQGKPLVCPRAHLGVPPKIMNRGMHLWSPWIIGTIHYNQWWWIVWLSSRKRSRGTCPYVFCNVTPCNRRAKVAGVHQISLLHSAQPGTHFHLNLLSLKLGCFAPAFEQQGVAVGDVCECTNPLEVHLGSTGGVVIKQCTLVSKSPVIILIPSSTVCTACSAGPFEDGRHGAEIRCLHHFVVEIPWTQHSQQVWSHCLIPALLVGHGGTSFSSFHWWLWL